jgi:3D (Asp-Asp-Asp) domain-containing protein
MCAITLLVGIELFTIAKTSSEAQQQPLGLMVIDSMPVKPIHPTPATVHAELAMLPPPNLRDVVVNDVPAVKIEAKKTSQEVELPVVQPDELIYFDSRPLRKTRTIRMLVTAYSPDEKSCGIFADGVTASGFSVWTNGMKLVAADTSVLPFKSIITVPGYNGDRPVPILDRGGSIKGNRLDVLYPTHAIAKRWGKQWLEVDVWEYAD